jgi:hypothetical protein
MTNEEIASCVTIGKGAMLKVIGGKAKHGTKSKAQEEFMGVLKEAGAVQESTYNKVEVTKEEK